MIIIEFIKKRALIILFVLVMAAWVANSILSRTLPLTQTPQGPGISYKDLVPGVSSKGDALEKMGKLIKETSKGDESLLIFESTSPTRNHETIINNENTVSFIKEIVSVNDDKHVEDMTSQYGEAPFVLYGPYSVNGYDLFVYPDKGIAFIGNPYGTEGAILEIWYFPPTTIENFKSTWAKSYSETLQGTQ